ncbi:MAG: hypothetical protein NC112_02620 [Oxalobacter formigenes]|nr:hypothetical protein [Oxalobacter formigenes]
MIPSSIPEPRLESLKNTAWWLYIFHSIDLVIALGLFSWIPLIISYAARPNTTGTFIYSHHTWQIRSFWLYFGLAALGWFFFVSIIGIPLAYLVWAVAWIWKAYRMIKGILTLNRNQPISA